MKRIQRGLCNTMHEVCTKHPSAISVHWKKDLRAAVDY